MADGDGVFLESFDGVDSSELGSLRFATVVGRFYEDLARRLEDGARAGFAIAGVQPGQVEHHSVPGAYELPMAAKLLADTGDFAGVACLGVVIRGETAHFDYVCGESARGVQDVQLATGVPCAFGVITCDTMDQALARAGGDKRDQGRNAALTVCKMALMKRRIA
jgi:6,7-dimethyl-8-ribityllumazine synthase